MTSADLTAAARSRVTAGITADNRADAQRILANLRSQRLPLCRTTAGTTTPGTTTPGATTDDATTTTTPPADSGLTPPASPVTTSAPAPDTTTGSTTASPTRTGGAEVDCREAD
jgi:protein phosphatase